MRLKLVGAWKGKTISPVLKASVVGIIPVPGLANAGSMAEEGRSREWKKEGDSWSWIGKTIYADNITQAQRQSENKKKWFLVI